jgi:hypothetical protein
MCWSPGAGKPRLLPVLYADDYGFHQGDIWYRGHFTATGTETAINLTGDTGNDGGGAHDQRHPARDYRALIYVNGWLVGRYINNLGPEHTFPIPDGILRTDGDNTIALAVLNLDPVNGGIGSVGLPLLGNARSSLQVADVGGPGWSAGTYGSPAGLAAEPQATLQTAPVIAPGTSAEVTGVTTNVGGRVLNRAIATLTVPAAPGWRAGRPPAASACPVRMDREMGDLPPGQAGVDPVAL